MIKWSQEPRGPREITFEEFYALTLSDTFVGSGGYLGGWSPYIRGSIQRILPSLEGVKKYDYYTIVDTPNVVEYQMGEEIEFFKNGDHLVATYNSSGELVWTHIKPIKIIDHIDSF